MAIKHMMIGFLGGLVCFILLSAPVGAVTPEGFSWDPPQNGAVAHPSPGYGACGASLTENFTTVRAWVTVCGHVITQNIVTIPITEQNWSSVLDPAISMDPYGNAIVMWTQEVAYHTYNIFASVYTNGTGWGTPVQVQSGPTAFDPQVGFDADGNAVAIFEVKVGEHPGWTLPDNMTICAYNLFSSRYTPGSGWGEVQKVQSGDEELTYYDSQLSVNAAGRAVAVWAQKDADGSVSVWGNDFEPGTGWGTGQELFHGGAYDVDIQAAIDADGNAVAVWGRSYQDMSVFLPNHNYVAGVNMPDYNFYDVYADWYVNGTGWLHAERVQHGDGQVGMPWFQHHVSIEQVGVAVADWTVYDSGSAYSCTLYLGDQGSVHSGSGDEGSDSPSYLGVPMSLSLATVGAASLLMVMVVGLRKL